MALLFDIVHVATTSKDIDMTSAVGYHYGLVADKEADSGWGNQHNHYTSYGFGLVEPPLEYTITSQSDRNLWPVGNVRTAATLADRRGPGRAGRK